MRQYPAPYLLPRHLRKHAQLEGLERRVLHAAHRRRVRGVPRRVKERAELQRRTHS